MTLQDEMFRLIEDWKNSGMPKLEFLKKKNITKDKFGYWKQKVKKPTRVERQNNPSIFKEIDLPATLQVPAINKVIELTTPDGLQSTSFPFCLQCSIIINLQQFH